LSQGLLQLTDVLNQGGLIAPGDGDKLSLNKPGLAGGLCFVLKLGR
jgi:hypothetical protein